MKQLWIKLADKFSDKALVAAVTALIVAVGGQVINFRQDSRMEYRSLAEEYREETNRLRAIERQCLKMEVSLSREIDQLRSKLIMLESASHDLPFPHWLKSSGTIAAPGIMLALNQAYEDKYLLPIGKTADDYIGKTDAQFWGEEIGDRNWAGDMEVISSNAPLDRMEVDPFQSGDSIRVIKYPRKLGSRTIGIGGMIIPDKN